MLSLNIRFHCRIYAFWLLSTTCLFLLSNASFAQELNAELIPLLEKHRGDVAVMIKNLDTGETFEYHSDVVMPTASLIKFPVLIELYRQAEQGALTLDKPITLKETDKVPGSGILTQHFNAEAVLSLHTIARLMITYSDNTATNLVLDQIGISNVAKTMTEMGFPETQIHSKVFRRDTSIAVERSQKFGLGSTTAKDMVLLLEKLHQRKLLSPNSCEAILAHLLTCDDKSKLARKLPAGVKFYHKTGAVNECRTDAGLLATPKGTIAIAVLTNKNRDTSWTDNNEAELLCAEVGDIVYRWYNPESLTVDSGSAVLKIGSNGILVEALQRALNRQLETSPSLSVDGDFGPATEKALKAFQVAKKLTATGIVDSKTWEALGPIELEEADREAEITQELPRKVDAEILSGAPFVSCKAWVIFDKQAGTSIEGNASDQRLEIASTTKMMTAWLVSKFASQHPEVLEERVTFSPRADNTPGSSATIRAGESVTVHELLYGLMLPSGNDAATALAEHFGDRLYGGAAESAPKNSYEKFAAAMNREASELGMKNTSFRNPHGWPHKEHYSSCFDLALLASKLLDSPLLREIVSARQFRCETQSVEGYRRALTWKNTNELLGIEGYIGIKTGTTDAAGACLVSCSVRENQELIVVTLGSSGSAARYADSRNLHRWGWLKRSGEANAKANDSTR
jgi:D-alanyl-D-alanine carboxypeptidase (penicillin-binding protein 5/6)